MIHYVCMDFFGIYCVVLRARVIIAIVLTCIVLYILLVKLIFILYLNELSIGEKGGEMTPIDFATAFNNFRDCGPGGDFFLFRAV